MASFCKDCSLEKFGKDFNDLAKLCDGNELVYVLCEGCGWIYVNRFGARIPDELVEDNEFVVS